VSELPTGTVTFLFTDLESSTRLWEEQPDAMRSALARHDELLTGTVQAYGGHVIKGTGDGVHAVFTTADAAVSAAVDAQRSLEAEPWGAIGSLRVRIGLHTGIAEQRGGDYFGPALNRAARLMGIAHAGQVLCSQATADLVRDCLPASVGLVELGAHRLRDLDRPEVVFQVTHPGLAASFPPLLTSGGVGNLPRQMTSFVGHEQDLGAIAAELEQTSVVTLTGIGGVGKTRLALEVAAQLAACYRDGAWLCELAGAREDDVVPDVVLETFGVEPRQGVTAHETALSFLRAKELLLVLDNCEHLLKPVARLVSDIVRSCPGVRVLATSREGLHVAGERILVVPSLDVPESDDVAVIAASDAVLLFVARAQAVRGDFVLDAANANAVAQVCQRLDGVPLAIELAAARAPTLTPAELAARLDQRFRLLTGRVGGAIERHQTLRGAIDWSYDLLVDLERRLFDRLSVFVAGFNLTAAEAVTAGHGIDASEVLDLLAGLVERSLVVADTEGVETRYRLLETVREYADERLEIAGETARVRDTHAQYYVALAEQAVVGMLTARGADWLRLIAREVDNIRAALAWVIQSRDTETALRFFALGDHWVFSYISEIGQLLVRSAPLALSLPGITEDPGYSHVLAMAAEQAGARGDLEEMRRYCDEALAAEQRFGVGPTLSVARARTNLASGEGHIDELIQYTQSSVAIVRARGDDPWLAVVLGALALAHSLKGEDGAAVSEAEEALTLAERTAAPLIIQTVKANAMFALADTQPERAGVLMEEAIQDKDLLSPLRGGGFAGYALFGDVAERLGDRDRALEYFVRGMDAWHWIGHSDLVGRMLRRIGLLLVPHDPETAVVLISAGLARSRSATLTQRAFIAQEQGIEALKLLLGTDAFRELDVRGRAMYEHDAVELAHSAAAKVLSSNTP
jgi:predicted ATPase/class 3 adenylate cyclase